LKKILLIKISKVEIKKQMDKWLEKFNNIEFLSLILKLTLILGLKIKI